MVEATCPSRSRRHGVLALESVVGEPTFSTIFRGIAPFIVTDLVRLAILAAVPALAAWLRERL